MTIKHLSGKILILLYVLQRNSPIELQDMQLSIAISDKFEGNRKPPYFLHEDTKLPLLLHQITNNDALLYNALHYLFQKSLISFSNKGAYRDSASESYLGLHLTDTGIDTVEGIERDPPSRSHFTTLFNITINAGVNVDSLIKNEVGHVKGIEVSTGL